MPDTFVTDFFGQILVISGECLIRVVDKPLVKKLKGGWYETIIYLPPR